MAVELIVLSTPLLTAAKCRALKRAKLLYELWGDEERRTERRAFDPQKLPAPKRIHLHSGQRLSNPPSKVFKPLSATTTGPTRNLAQPVKHCYAEASALVHSSSESCQRKYLARPICCGSLCWILLCKRIGVIVFLGEKKDVIMMEEEFMSEELKKVRVMMSLECSGRSAVIHNACHSYLRARLWDLLWLADIVL